MFLPRSLKCKGPKNAQNVITSRKRKRAQTSLANENLLTRPQPLGNSLWKEKFLSNISRKELDTKESSREQRLAEQGEPICCICGKYGEYICDDTEVDVCSKECKQLNLLNRNLKKHQSMGGEEVKRLQAELGAMVELFPPPNSSNSTPDLPSTSTVPIPLHGSFLETGLFHDTLVKNLELYGFCTPTPIQAQGIACGLGGQDVVLSAPAGAGKTLAALLMSLARLMPQRYMYPNHVLVLVVAPTRELCLHIENQAKQLLKGIPIARTAAIIGGVPLPQQVYRVKKGVQVAVATPGRLNDIVNKDPGVAQQLFGQLKTIIVDEADEVVSHGFKKQFKEVVENINKISSGRPQWLLSTNSPRIKGIEDFLNRQRSDDEFGFIVTLSKHLEKKIPHKIFWVANEKKATTLCRLMQSRMNHKTPAVIFVSRRMGCELLERSLTDICNANCGKKNGVQLTCTSLHGEMEQAARCKAMEKFNSGSVQVLVATDIASKGLDFTNVHLIVNFDVPSSLEALLQRSSIAGISVDKQVISFVNDSDKNIFPELLAGCTNENILISEEVRAQMKESLSDAKNSNLKKRAKVPTLSDKEKEQRVDQTLSIQATRQWNSKWKSLAAKSKRIKKRSTP